jgi:hypothetical protein
MTTESRRVEAAFFALLLAGAPVDSGAQELRSTGEDQSCGCRIVLQRVAQLGRADDTVALSPRSQVARDSHGFFYAAPLLQDGVVAVFGPTGAFTSLIGRPGRGPGDLAGIRHIRIAPHDSLLVLEYDRLSLFGPDGVFARTVPVPAGVLGFRFAVQADGRVVLNNYMPKHSSFVVLGPAVRTFGHSIAGRDSDALQFLLAALDSGRFAAVQQNYRYLVQVWDTAGVMRREFRRDPEWFPRSSYEERLGRTPRSPPSSRVLGAQADLVRRRLWITAVVPDRNWRVVAPEVEPGHREVTGWFALKVSDYARAYDTVLEVLDLDTGKVIATQRFDAYVPYLIDAGLLYGPREDPSGMLVLDVWRGEIVIGGR